MDETGQHRWNCPQFQGTRYHANVVMCPDDTLGLFGWETLDLGRRTRLRVNSANGEAPWKSYPTNPGAQPEVKKLAFLGPDIARNPGIVQFLNHEASWDVDSILHSKSTSIRVGRLDLPYLASSSFLGPPCFNEQVLVQSRKFNGSLQE